MSDSLRILVTAYDYRPSMGGVATCAFEATRALSAQPGVEVKLLARQHMESAGFDQAAAFETRRLALDSVTAKAALQLSAHIGREMVTWRPQAVLNFLWMPCGLATYLSAPARVPFKVPYFMFAHGMEVMEAGHTLTKRIRRALSPVKRQVFGSAAEIFAVSRFTAGLVEKECGVSSGRITVVNNGVDSSSFFPAHPAEDLIAKHGLAGKKVFLTLSRLEDYKGVDRAIASLRHVVDRHPEAVLLVCGTGPDRPRLEAITDYYRLRKHVIFAGAVPFERLRDYYSISHCFVLLSRRDDLAPNVEGFGIVFLEAAACEKPSIAGNSGGISDAVEHGVSGWLVDPTDDRQIAQAMLESLENPAKTAALGAQARHRAATRFTWQLATETIVTRIRHHVRNSRTSP